MLTPQALPILYGPWQPQGSSLPAQGACGMHSESWGVGGAGRLLGNTWAVCNRAFPAGLSCQALVSTQLPSGPSQTSTSSSGFLLEEKGQRSRPVNEQQHPAPGTQASCQAAQPWAPVPLRETLQRDPAASSGHRGASARPGRGGRQAVPIVSGIAGWAS